jgi:hypothetical protein
VLLVGLYTERLLTCGRRKREEKQEKENKRKKNARIRRQGK